VGTATDVRPLIEFEGKTPAGCDGRLIRIPLDGILKHFSENSVSFNLEEAWLLPDICREPAGIWRGLNRKGQDEAYCYAGIPLGVFAQEHNHKVVIPERKVLMVFLNPVLEVTKYRFCEPDPTTPGFPIDHDTRFGAQLWP
jgi:hypothetical protein